MKTILHIDNVPDKVIGEKTFKERDLFNSCLLCSQGRGIYKVHDDVKNEAYYLCEKHKACFDEAAKDLSPETKKALANDDESIAKETAKKSKPDIFTEAAAKDKAAKET